MPNNPETREQSIDGRLRIALWNVLKGRGMGEDVIYLIINDVMAEIEKLGGIGSPEARQGEL